MSAVEQAVADAVAEMPGARQAAGRGSDAASIARQHSSARGRVGGAGHHFDTRLFTSCVPRAPNARRRDSCGDRHGRRPRQTAASLDRASPRLRRPPRSAARSCSTSAASTVALRQVAGGEGRLARDPPQRDHRADRAVGLRQVDRAALPEPDERPRRERARRRQDPLPRHRPLRRRRRPDRGAPPDRHGLPAAEPVPEVDLRQRRLRPADPRHEGRPRRPRRARAARRRALGRGQEPAARSRRSGSPAASSSASASRARSPSSPT